MGLCCFSRLVAGAHSQFGGAFCSLLYVGVLQSWFVIHGAAGSESEGIHEYCNHGMTDTEQ